MSGYREELAALMRNAAPEQDRHRCRDQSPAGRRSECHTPRHRHGEGPLDDDVL